MPASSRKETERRLRKMAIGMVDMEQGIYQWPNGRKALKRDGSPVISKMELVRSAGYSHIRTGQQYRWFEDPYFKRQVALEKARREKNLPDVLEEHPTNLLKLGRGMIDEALIRLEKDADSFSNAQLLTFGPQIVKLGLELEARDAPNLGENRTNRIGELNAFLGNTIVQMAPDEREQLVDTTVQANDQRMRKLQSMVDALQAQEEDDADVIDAEISPESS